jgi:hypothetical protein
MLAHRLTPGPPGCSGEPIQPDRIPTQGRAAPLHMGLSWELRLVCSFEVCLLLMSNKSGAPLRPAVSSGAPAPPEDQGASTSSRLLVGEPQE